MPIEGGSVLENAVKRGVRRLLDFRVYVIAILIRLHILHHASKHPLTWAWMQKELAEHGYVQPQSGANANMIAYAFNRAKIFSRLN